ncbi:hypothetical protein LCGC14_3029730 [marine sediment metagenome]|uniref:Uncharacterized protein n=1 Tax=marine sediment metagenome TaxID=412755 RepID=A0A0F8XG20_9ZZZZ
MNVLYFGYLGYAGGGHGLVDEFNPRASVWKHPLGTKLDGGFAPEGRPEVEGVARLHHVKGWTVLAFWDRSGDSRGKSNAAFLAEGGHSFDDLLAAARKQHPGIFQRFTFDVVLLPPATPTEGEQDA